MHITIKDHIRESRLFNERAAVALIFACLLLILLLSRMIYLQVVNYEHYATLSNNNRISITPTAPPRGLIYDRNGVLLAQNLPSFSLEVIPERVPDMDQTVAELAELLPISEAEQTQFFTQLRHKQSFSSIPLRFNLTEKEVARFAANRHRFPGVEIEAQLIRNYPQGKLAAHTIGYVGQISEEELQVLDVSNYRATRFIGKTGVEKFYEGVLHGTVGYNQTEINAVGRNLQVLKKEPPVPGQNLYLTIDARLQLAAEQALHGRRGSIVAIDPQNGDVLAMASTPSYDPNLFAAGIDYKTYRALQQSPDKPLFNRSLQGQYPPGSTIKPFIGIAGLDQGVTRINSVSFCPGWYTLKGDDHRYRDWKKEGHGRTTLDQAITQSCDVYFYDLALNLGIDRIYNTLSQFGFGQRTGIDLKGEPTGLLPSREWKKRKKHQIWFPGETLIVGIGQGYTLTTPLQLANAAGIMAMKGHRMQPRLVYAMQDPATDNVSLLAAVEKPRVDLKNETYWNQIINAMTHVVHSRKGTAHHIGYGLPFKMAGKTGTAQVFGIKQDEEYVKEEVAARLRDHSLFIAFAPVKNPKIAVSVIVENGGSGSAVAAPIARKIIEEYLLKDMT